MKQLIALVIVLMTLGVTEVIAQKHYQATGTNKKEVQIHQEINFSFETNVPKYVPYRPHILASLMQHGEYSLSSKKLPGRYKYCFLMFIPMESSEMIYLDAKSVSYDSAVPREGEAEIAWWNILWGLAIVALTICWWSLNDEFLFWFGSAIALLMTGLFDITFLINDVDLGIILCLILGFATTLLVFALLLALGVVEKYEKSLPKLGNIFLVIGSYVVTITVTASTYYCLWCRITSMKKPHILWIRGFSYNKLPAIQSILYPLFDMLSFEKV